VPSVVTRVIVALAVMSLLSSVTAAPRDKTMAQTKEKIPVILDTDIGGDIDDTWALAMLLKCPELDLKLVVSDTGNTTYRAKIVAKMLEVAGRTDVPVGVGTSFDSRTKDPQGEWVKDYDLSAYPGTVHEDGVQALIDTIMASEKPVTLICIGPVPNIGEALRREPKIAEKARFVGMHGSVRKGYGGKDKIDAECNVVNHTPDCQEAFTAPWDITITPLDTCGLIVLKGERYQKVRECQDPLIRALMENYDYWAHGHGWANPDVQSSTLFDTVAVYLAFTEKLLEMETLPIRVTDDGFTVIEEGARMVHCAMKWKDQGAFEDFLVNRLTGQ